MIEEVFKMSTGDKTTVEKLILEDDSYKISRSETSSKICKIIF
jgi:hypothetical protein